jgi:tellurite resistance protein TerA
MGIDYTKRPPSTAPAAPNLAAPAPAAPAPAAATAGALPVRLTKVTLTKAAPTVSLTKHGGASGLLRVNLNWDAKAPERGFFKKHTQLDLDLGCLYEFSDGSKGVVQAMGNAFSATDRSRRRIIWLDGDDRSGKATTGENLFVDLANASVVKRILVFALIYEGAANWAAANALATLMPLGAPPVEIRLDDPRDGARICAIAMIENKSGEIVVRREINYLNGAQRLLDETYGWGMNWARGRK